MLGAVAWLNAAFSIALRNDVRRLFLARFAVLELGVAFGLYAADGWVFAPGHVFGSQLALASSWPLVAVLSVAIVHGHRVGLVAGAFERCSVDQAAGVHCSANVPPRLRRSFLYFAAQYTPSA